MSKSISFVGTGQKFEQRLEMQKKKSGRNSRIKNSHPMLTLYTVSENVEITPVMNFKKLHGADLMRYTKAKNTQFMTTILILTI